MDYIDLISDFGVQKKPQGYKNFKVVECAFGISWRSTPDFIKINSRAGLEEFLNISTALAIFSQS